MEFLFVTMEHYNRYWYDRLLQLGAWDEFDSSLPPARGGADGYAKEEKK